MNNYFFIIVLWSNILICKIDLPNIIIINGPSSSGKSSICYYLQQILPDYSIISYDDLRIDYVTKHAKSLGLLSTDYVCQNFFDIFMNIKKYFKTLPVQEAESKIKLWRKVFNSFDQEFYKNINELSFGKKLIVDGFIVDQEQINIVKTLDKTKIFTIFVHASLDKVVERVSKRNLLSVVKEIRDINRVIYVYLDFYQTSESKNNSIPSISRQQIKDVILESSKSKFIAKMFPISEELYEYFINKLQIQNQQEIFLLPKSVHDYIINASDFNPEECADEINKILLSRTTNFSIFA